MILKSEELKVSVYTSVYTFSMKAPSPKFSEKLKNSSNV